jgi:ubiquitin-conjugating enzyme E2 M
MSKKSTKIILKIFHPNIDFEGNVCLNLLREDYTPAVTIKMIIFGLITLFNVKYLNSIPHL